MTRCKYWDCGWCYCKTGNSNDINGKCMSPMECQQLASQQQLQQHAAIEDKVMTNEKMREEFEAWFCSTMPYKIAKESWFAVMDDGDYIITDVQAGWAGWKASRAALCVELPEARVLGGGRIAEIGYELALDDFEMALDAAGVRYK